METDPETDRKGEEPDSVFTALEKAHREDEWTVLDRIKYKWDRREHPGMLEDIAKVILGNPKTPQLTDGMHTTTPPRRAVP